ncbi:hypothetical protein AVEN_3214-1, partial [Araneus ventricosus]
VFFDLPRYFEGWSDDEDGISAVPLSTPHHQKNVWHMAASTKSTYIGHLW